MKYIKILFLLTAFSAQADVLIKLDIQQGIIKNDSVYIRLFEDTAPLTVANFLSYVNNTTANGGNYNNMFFNRLATGFVLQGGGFSFDPLVGSFSYDSINSTYNGGLQNIATDDPVDNEYSRANTYGTISMAKFPGDPNSATNEWFVNLADNTDILGPLQNQGFTVFAEVLGNGMTIFEEINTIPAYDKSLDVNSAFASLPLVSYSSGPITQENLVSVNSIVEIATITSDLDFGLHLLSANPTLNLTITNKTPSSLNIGSIANNNALATPFSIISDNCAGTTLATISSSCTITVQYSAQTEGVVSDDFNIEFTNIPLDYVVNVKGEGTTLIAPEVTLSETILDFGEQPIYDPANGLPEILELQIINDGNADLDVSSVTFTGPDTQEFELFDNCTTFSPVKRNDLCRLFIHFKPQSIGTKNATLTITTNDSDEGTIIIPVTGIGSLDVDGIPIAIEDAASNNGDANFDNILDSTQSNVASFLDLNNNYITLQCTSEKEIRNINVIDQSQFPPLPNGSNSQGIFMFTVDDAIPGSIIELGFIQNTYFDTVYLYGPTYDDANPHWHILDNTFDIQTETTILGYSTLTSQASEAFWRYRAKLDIREGGMGDTDFTVNGEAMIIVALVSKNSANSSNVGFINIKLLLLLILVTFSFRYFYKTRVSSNTCNSIAQQANQLATP